MGSSQSRGQVLSKGGGAQRQEHQLPPYPGPSVQYQFVNTDVVMSTSISFGFLQNQMVTSNIDAYYPYLAQQYAQGFRLLSFYHIPGQAQRTGGLFSREVSMPFQGIFCRYPTQPCTTNYQLKIEKSVIQPQIVWNGFISMRSDVRTDIQHLFQTIANNTQNGGRLICIELTGQETIQHSFSVNQRMPIMGCDLFFEMPVGGDPVESYVYNVVSAPMHISIKSGFRPTPTVQCDWAGIMGQQLSQGWRLVEIFMDQTASSQASGFTSRSQMNTQWFFEKPASRANDPTPVYEGTVVEHLIHMQAGFAGVRTTANWEPIIQNMGHSGWELACILETPEITFSGLQSFNMKVLLFFQRPIIAFGPPPVAYPAPFGQPPPYEKH